MNQPYSNENDPIMSAVMDHVRAVAEERAKNLTPDTNVVELGLDSLERMEIAANLEQSFAIRIPESILPEIETCQEIADAIRDCQASKSDDGEIPEEFYDLEKLPEWQQLQRTVQSIEAVGEKNPFYTVHETTSTDRTKIAGQEMINFSGYNYLGMSGDPAVADAAKLAIDEYGTSVSASRLVAGTRPVHVELEEEIAKFTGAEDAVTFVSGYLTNNVVIGHLMGPGDLVVQDELVHNSIIFGTQTSGAARRTFPHNDWQALDDLLKEVRGQYRKVLIVVEGVYSMDGDFPDLPKFVEVKRRHRALLMVDEAHSIGTMGANGRGMSEYFGISASDADIWMGTLGKALGACGGYICGKRQFIQYMKLTCPGIVFSIGLSPSSASAALKALQLLQEDPQRVATLQVRAAFFLTLCRQRGLNTGTSSESPVVPVIIGNSLKALKASRMMHERGVSVQPILHPAVSEEKARLRFFISCLHSNEQLSTAVEHLANVLKELDAE